MHRSIFIEEEEMARLVDSEEYFGVLYSVQTTETPEVAAWDIAVGQTIGNPNARSTWETDSLWSEHGPKALVVSENRDPRSRQFYSTIYIAYPTVNIDWETDGVSQLLCIIMGGQVDISHIQKCRVEEIQLPQSWKLSPKFGLTGMREFTKQWKKPLLGGIVKPKTGLRPDQLLDLVKEMVDGGCDFIKEDEILSNPTFCRLEDRLPKIMNYLDGKKVIYAPCINSDPAHVLDRARLVYELGGNGLHVNIWSGLGVYKSIHELDLPLFIHYQKSGDRVITDPANRFSISWKVLLELAARCGVDSIHTGMYGGYLSDDDRELNRWMVMLRSFDVIPALSCGMNPNLVKVNRDRFGNGFMANVGGYIHSHPDGTQQGTRIMREAIDN